MRSITKLLDWASRHIIASLFICLIIVALACVAFGWKVVLAILVGWGGGTGLAEGFRSWIEDDSESL